MTYCPNYSDPKFKEIIAALGGDPVTATQYYYNYNGDLDTLYEDIVSIPYMDRDIISRTGSRIAVDTYNVNEEVQKFFDSFVEGNKVNINKFLSNLEQVKNIPNLELGKVLNDTIEKIWNPLSSNYSLTITMVPVLPRNAVGEYNPDNNTIQLSLEAIARKANYYSNRATKENLTRNMYFYVAALINHEILHSLHPYKLNLLPVNSFQELKKFIETDIDLVGRYYSEKDKKFALALGELYFEAIKAGYKPDPNVLKQTPEHFYGMTNLGEFFSEAMTSREFQLALSQIPYKTTKKSIWQKFLDILTKAFSDIYKISIKNTLLEETIGQITNYIENNQYLDVFKTEDIIKADNTKTQVTYGLPSAAKSITDLDKLAGNLKKQFIKEVKLNTKEISGLQRVKVINRIKSANLKLDSKFKVTFKQVGQADLYTWEITDLLGPTIPEKAEKSTPEKNIQLNLNFYKDRVLNDPTFDNPDTVNGAALRLNPAIYDTINDIADANTASLAAMDQLARTMSSQLGDIPYSFITQEQAASIIKARYKNQPAFYYNGQVYFIIDMITPEIMFHEFSHPFIKALAYYNPQLFNKLYDELMATPEGIGIYNTIVESNYEDLTEGSDRFKEEALVRSMQKKFRIDQAKIETTTGFQKFIKELLYQIKRVLRQVFGKKIDISKLDVNTSMNDIITMLEKGGEFFIDRKIITNKDIEFYQENTKKFIDEISLLDSNEHQAILKEAYDTIAKHITLLQSNKNYQALFEVLKDQFNETELDAIKSNISKHIDIINKKAVSFLEDAKTVNNRATAIINTVYRLNKVMSRFDEHMDDLVNNIDNQGNGLRAFYYRQLAVHYKDFVQSLIKSMEGVIPANASVRGIVNELDTRIDSIINKTKQFDFKISSDALTEQLKYIGEAINNKYNDIINDLKERARKRNEDPKKYIDAWYKEWKGMTQEEYAEYETLRSRKGLSIKDNERLAFLQKELFKGAEITKEKIEIALKGLSSDANPFSSFLEGYLYNSDVVVGGFALFIKNATTEYMATAQSKMNDFFNDVYPLMEAAGFNPNKTDEFFDKITTLQSFGRLKDEEMVQQTVNSFLSIHGGNYRWERDSRRDAIKKAEAEYSYNRGSEENRLAFAKAVKALRDWEIKYMHNFYHPYFYERYNLFTDDAIGIEASARYEEAIQELGAYEHSIFSESQYLDTTLQREAARQKYKQLFSKYKDGVKKEGFELAVAERLIAFKNKTKELYQWVERPGAFIKALQQYQQELINQGITKDNPMFRTKTELWIEANTVVKNKQSYWDNRKRLIDRYKEIISSLNKETQEAIDISGVYQEIIDLSKPYRDNNGHVDGTEMSEAERKAVKKYEERIEELKKNIKKLSGLTEQEHDRLTELASMAAKLKGTGERLSPDDSLEMQNLFYALKTGGLSPALKSELHTIYMLLGEMTIYQPTQAYMDELNEILKEKPIEDYLRSIGKVNEYNQLIEYTPNNITALFGYETSDLVLKELKNISPTFKKWFDQNHIVRKRYDPIAKRKKDMYERLYIWNISVPSDPNDLEQTLIQEENGYTYAIKRVPNLRFFKNQVKESIKIVNSSGREETIVLKTPDIIGVTKDNKGQWLPRTDVPDSPYIDENYVKLRDSSDAKDKAVFKALEALKDYHLKAQEGLSYHSKLYLDVPRYQKENLDILRTRKKREKAVKDGTNAPPESKKVGSILSIMMDRAKQFIYGVKEASELDGTGAQMSYKKDTMVLVRVDSLDNDITDIPIGGLYDIEYYDVSTDVGKSVLRYMLSAERHKKLLEISPVAKAIQNTVIENRPNAKNQIDKKNLLYRSIISSLRPKDESVREKAINNLIDREFHGELNTGFGADSAFANNLSNAMFKTAAFGFFALNIPSALKNMITPKIQGAINAAGGDFLDYGSLAKGEAWSFRTMGQLSFEIYKPKAHNLDLQLTEIMDIVPNRFVEKFGERVSRTILKDAVGKQGFNFSWLYNFRKWTETESTLALAGGMMAKQQVKTKDGTKVSFLDAWQLNENNKIVLKPNIDPEWGITYDENGKMKVGKEFLKFKNYVQQAGTLFQGAYATFEQPELQRHLLGRFITFLKRYLTPSLIARWGFTGDFGNVRPRFNPGLGNMHMGYYISSLRTLLRIIKSRGGWIHYLAPQEKADMLKFLSEVVIVKLLLMLLSPLFGWDPEDEDKYEKLRRKSGPLPLPGIVEDPRYPFQVGGYLENHALLLMMQLRNENEQFLPWPNYGLDDYTSLLDLKSIAIDPTFKRLEDILTMTIAEITGDDKAYYKRSIGPYAWQQEEGSKLINYMLKTLGISGSAAEPVKGIKDLQGVIVRR